MSINPYIRDCRRKFSSWVVRMPPNFLLDRTHQIEADMIESYRLVSEKFSMNPENPKYKSKKLDLEDGILWLRGYRKTLKSQTFDLPVGQSILPIAG